MSVRTFLVAHPERMMAEAIAGALDKHRLLLSVGTATTCREIEGRGRTDLAALDARLPDCSATARRLRRAGTRVVVIGPPDEETFGISVSADASIDVLARALLPEAAVGPSNGTEGLTAREHEVFSLAARGLAGKQIASHLGISAKTVEHHKSRVFRKLGVPNQAAAVALISASGRRTGRVELAGQVV